MARMIGPACKLCRQEGMKLFLKGKRCYSDKCILARREYRPGERRKTPRKLSDYGLRLREKQKVRKIYGLMERQFRRYYEEASRKKGITGENLFLLLERRLDNVVFRLGFSLTRSSARQLVRHSHFVVNNKKVNIPSYLVKVGDEISLRARSKKIIGIKEALKLSQEREKAPWLTIDREKFRGKVLRFPKREEIGLPIQEKLIVEYYSR